MRRNLRQLALAMMLATLTGRANEAEGAPVWQASPRYQLLQVENAALPAAWDDFDKREWAKAQVIGPLSSKGTLEDASRRTQVKMIQAQGAVYVFARCFENKFPATTAPGDRKAATADALEMLFAAKGKDHFPQVYLALEQGGACRARRETAPSTLSGPILFEQVEPGMVSTTAGEARDGWWVAAAVPLEKLGVAPREFAMNLFRSRAGENAYFAWNDLWGGRLRNVLRLGHVKAVAAMESVPTLALPCELAVGRNQLKLSGWREGFTLKSNGVPTAVDKNGVAAVDVETHGPVALTVENAAGQQVAGYACDVRRPLIVQAKPAQEGKVAVEITAEIAASAKVPLALALMQEGKRVGQQELTIGSGKQILEISGAKQGDVQVFASGPLKLGEKTVELAARHWCLLGDVAEFDRYREGLEKLPTPAFIRAAVCDVGAYKRLVQTGEGAFGPTKGDTFWQQAGTYVMAAMYKTKWAENPHYNDERFLAAATLGMESATDPLHRQTWRNHPDNRSLQAYLMTYELIKDDVPAAQAQRWKTAMSEMVEAVIVHWIMPMDYHRSLYSEEIGTSTNHWSLHAANVYTAGRIFQRKDWEELGRISMRRLARHEREGNFSERRRVPTPSYNWVTATGLAEYAFQSGDAEMAESMTRSAEFAWRTSIAPGEQLNLFDGRVNGHTAAAGFPIMMACSPEGSGLLRECLMKLGRRGPSRFSTEGLHRWCELAMFASVPEVAKPLPLEDEFTFMDGLALIGRSKGFAYGLAAMSDQPMQGLFRLDAQNALELHHRGAGRILLGDNSQKQPEAGSFFRKPAAAGNPVWLPIDGRIARMVGGGHLATLEFDGFTTSLAAKVISDTTTQVRVEVVEATGNEPIIYNFFPASAEAQLADGGKTIRFGNVTISTSLPVALQKDFRIYNPYGDAYTIRAKPTRAFLTLEKGKPFVMTVNVAGK